jgi:hypothetical protein
LRSRFWRYWPLPLPLQRQRNVLAGQVCPTSTTARILQRQRRNPRRRPRNRTVRAPPASQTDTLAQRPPLRGEDQPRQKRRQLPRPSATAAPASQTDFLARTQPHPRILRLLSADAGRACRMDSTARDSSEPINTRRKRWRGYIAHLTLLSGRTPARASTTSAPRTITGTPKREPICASRPRSPKAYARRRMKSIPEREAKK